MKIATRLRNALMNLCVFVVLALLPGVGKSQGFLPSKWAYGALTQGITIAYSPDGKLLAVGGEGGVQIWTVATKSLLLCLPTAVVDVNSIAFSPDGKNFALGGSTSPWGNGWSFVEIWSVPNWTYVRSMVAQSQTVYSIAFSPDGKLVADGGWYPGTVELWQVSTGKRVTSLKTNLNTATCVKFSPNGSILAAGGYSGPPALELWDVASGHLLRSLPTISTEVYSLSFSPDGKSLVSGGFEFTTTQFNAGITEVWDVASGKLVKSLDTGSTGVGCVGYSPDGKTIGVSSVPPVGSHPTLGLYDASTFKLITTLTSDPVGIANQFAFTPNGKSLSSIAPVYLGYTINSYLECVTWDLHSGAQTSSFSPTPYTSLSAIAFTPDGKRIVGGGFQTLSGQASGWLGLWDGERHQLVKSFNSSDGSGITKVAVSSDGTLLAGASAPPYWGGSLSVWNLVTGNFVSTLTNLPQGPVTSLAFSPTSVILAVANTSANVVLWNVASGKVVQNLVTSATNGVTSIAFSPDGTRLLVCGSQLSGGSQCGVLEIWNVSTGERWGALRTGLFTLSNVVFSSDGKMIADGGVLFIPSQNRSIPAIELWQAPFNQPPTYLPVSETAYPVGNLAFTPDNSELLAVIPAGIQVFSTAKNSALATFDIGSVDSMAVSQKTGQLAYASYGILQVAPIPSFGTASIATVSLDATEVTGGSGTTGTVTLTRAAPAGGMDVNLSSSNSSATVTPSVTIPAGATKASFKVATMAVDSKTSLFISAGTGTAQKPATLVIDPPTLAMVQIYDSPIAGGNSSLAFISLNGSVGPAGLKVALSSSSTVASVPAVVTFFAEDFGRTITINTSKVSTPTTVTITATLGSVSKSGTLVVSPAVLGYMYTSPASLVGGKPSVGTLSLQGTVPAGGMLVNLVSSSSTVVLPSTVSIPAGASSATFPITTLAVSTDQTVTLTASSGGVTLTTYMTVLSPRLVSVTLNPASVHGGQSSTGTVTIGTAAPPGGLVISLSSNLTVAKVPSTVTIPAGATSATFAVSTTMVQAPKAAAISAVLGYQSVWGSLEIL